MKQPNVNWRPGINELRQRGSHWWPADIRAAVADSSPADFLQGSLHQFNEWLDQAPRDPDSLETHILSSPLAANLLLKHLMVLLDQGGERINRYSANRADLFESVKGISSLRIFWEDQPRMLHLPSFSRRKNITNQSLDINGPALSCPPKDSSLCIDVLKLLFYGSLSTNHQAVEVFAGCIGYLFLGDPDFRSEFQAARYIGVSRITSGATANSSGQALQSIVEERLRELLPSNFEVQKNHVVDADGIRTTSDVFVSWPGGGAGIEVAFQETTNSTIERKGNEALGRLNSLHSQGLHACYVIDGEGCFQRAAAIQKICEASDCTVAFGEREFEILAEYIIGVST